MSQPVAMAMHLQQMQQGSAATLRQQTPLLQHTLPLQVVVRPLRPVTVSSTVRTEQVPGHVRPTLLEDGGMHSGVIAAQPPHVVRTMTTFRPTHGLTVLSQPVPRQAVPQLSDGWILVHRVTSGVLGSGDTSVTNFSSSAGTFHCPFCMENHRGAECVVFGSCGREDHGVCRDCMESYIRGLINDGRLSIECHQCHAPASMSEIRSLVDGEAFAKFERFRRMRQDPTVRECPGCKQLCKPLLNDEDEVVAEMCCPGCGSEFCYYHSNAHVGRSCTEYRREMAKQERLAEKGAMRGTKACPACGIRTEKTSGCNHMTCSHCDAHWCWICGEAVDLSTVTEHYAVGGPCSGRQFEDFTPGSPFACVLPWVVLPVKVLSILVFLLSVLTMLVWFPVSFICIVPCHRCKMSKALWRLVLMLAVALSSLPFVVFIVCWALISFFLYLVISWGGADIGHLIYLSRAPCDATQPLVFFFRRLYQRCREAGEAASVDDTSDEESGEVSGGEEANEPGDQLGSSMALVDKARMWKHAARRGQALGGACVQPGSRATGRHDAGQVQRMPPPRKCGRAESVAR
eukprot:CAMPEP_0195084732 /NCGR_PEP_ID=MMETSP0448-20130528/25345_1 /TAXON_ID=66468 /ORGANISM="Heterocapsa triquestra, Strain CCMP 448" /LENGTH=571 /DNA_ID=CAMNT_0040118087 /DNA_START=22 /DNA_END=1736 /DNA_ORIENTATION=+